MNKKQLDIDELDLKILSVLMEDAKTPYTEIGKKLFVSGGTIHVRMKKLQDIGIVKGAYLNIDHVLLGYDLSAFLGIYLKESSMYLDVIAALKEIPEIVSAHYTTGVYSIFARVICRDTDHLREVLSGKVQKIKGIQRTETFISLEESIQRPVSLSSI
ncbi:Lrp/AsnC ligand binding domain-containing protein [Portibacter lacus]|uniref:AsnC family transcriptional regulator n=1 Tax=Portibacter lacus TaxID=1099794 RepID=A0AA37SMS2_9BACT|nr:Lrp/AsnC ligand binding domain-containing protein [Portibacter lacus]GLR16219.1 AsnC family transcriptional regulator [Portibacter lacus]